MTEPTDENAAEAFCPAWDKVSDVFLYLKSIINEQKKRMVKLAFSIINYFQCSGHLLLENSHK
jgi:hypothetical protein